MTFSRRDFGRVALASLPLSSALAAAKPNSVVNGVHLGVQTYSFRDFPEKGVFPAIIKAMTDIGLSECELFGMQVTPGGTEQLAKLMAAGRSGSLASLAESMKSYQAEAGKWHMSVSLDYFKNIRKQFNDAGIEIFAYNGGSFNTDAEIDRSFEHARALGAKMITSSGTLSTAQKVAPFADKHKFNFAVHGHSDAKDPNQIATPESFTKALGMSKYIMANLDLGHFTATNSDAIAFIQEHHDRTILVHLKDRKKNQGPNMPFGQGDTPIKEVLQLIKKNKWPIRAYIEYEYAGKESSPAEVKKCFEYAKSCLA